MPSDTFDTVCTVGIPMDLGQSRRGVDMGPSAIRYAGLGSMIESLGYHEEACGNIDIPDREVLPPEGGLAYLPAALDACRRIYEVAREAVAEGHFPLFLGGDHSIALGTIGGVGHDEPVGVVWVDAHGDLNTPETSPSGNLHGMPLAALLGHGHPEMIDLGRGGAKIAPQDLTLIGVRDLDPGEQERIAELGLSVFTMREIDEHGIGAVADEALGRLAHCPRLHLSLDMDSLDPTEAPGVGTPVPGGLTYREAHLLMELLAETRRVRSADVVEINPVLDQANQTGIVACRLIGSLLGHSIL